MKSIPTEFVRKLAVILILLIMPLPFLLAQRMVTGNVSSSDDGLPLPGVNVFIQGTTRGVITGVDGVYTIQINDSDQILVYSFVGYKNSEIPIGDKTEIDVILQLETQALDELVVIGYGTVKKSDLTGAVSSVKSEDIAKITSSNPVQSLQGMVSGVRVTSTSGAPGSSPSVRIRGVGTFNNSAPIYVVDGVILDDISFLNSADIQSMEVLKDASATAIYGSRGANGVIMVTTKQGTIGETKISYNLSGEYGMQYLAKKINLLNGREFAVISNQIKPGSYNNVDAVPNTDWQDLIFSPAPVQNHQFSISGASNNAQYYFGVGYYNQKGIIDKSGYERMTLKLNNTYKLSDNLKLGNNFTLAPYSQENAPNVTYAVYRAQPLLEPYYKDGSYAVVYNVGNPLASLANSNDFNKGVRGVGNVFAELSLLKDIKIKSSFGLDAAYHKSQSFTPAYTVYNPDGTASQQDNQLSDLSKSRSDNVTWLWENTVSYLKVFGKNSFDAVAGYTMQQSVSENLGLSGENIIRSGSDFWYLNPSYILDENNNVNTLSSIRNGVDPNLYYSMISYLARVNYTYNSKYILTATFRRDGSSKFNKNNRFADFPSFAAGWNLGREDFIRDMDIFSILKIRASWGKIGNEKIPYLDRYDLVNSNMVSVFGLNPVTNPGATYGQPGNDNLKWETTTQTDIGLEFGFLNNRLTGEVDYYHKVTDDVLVLLSIPGHLGNGQGTKIRYNAASVLNSGFEFKLTWRETKGDFNYSISALGSTIHNEVTAIGGSKGIDSTLLGGYLGNGEPVSQSRVGLPIGAFYGYKTDGVFQSQAELDAYPHASNAGIGDLRFVNVNGDNVIDGKDRTFIGSPIPKFIFGLNMTFAYKAFDLSIDIQGQTGNKIFNGKEVVRPDPYNFEARVMDRWTGSGTSNKEPRPSFGGYNYTPSDWFIQDGSFARLRNVTLGYNIPASISDRLKMQNLRIYIKGTNIYTLTKFTGYSPEISSSDDLSNGIDFGIYPVTSVYSFGINISF